MKSKLVSSYLCMVALLGSFNSTANSQVDDPPITNQKKSEAIESLLSRFSKRGKLNGTVLVSEDSRVIFSSAFGYGKFEPEEKLQPDSCFRLGSVSKQITAMAIMILQERGKLSYEDDVRKHLPGLPYADVTIRHLLVHTGGLPDYMELFETEWDEKKVAFGKDVLELFIKHHPKIEFLPGEKYEYSNTGYALLGCIISKASGVSYAEFMDKNIFGPLEMNDSFCANGDKDQTIRNRVFGYNRKKKNIDFHYLNGVLGDGGIYSTTGDMFKWDQGLYTEKLVKKGTLQEALTPYKLNDGSSNDYGFGWSLHRSDQEDMIEHGGSWVGFSTKIRRDLKRGNSIIILTNMNGEVAHIVDAIDKILKE